LDENADTAIPLATIDVFSNGNLYKVGEHIVVTARRYRLVNGDSSTVLEVLDLSTPTAPAKLAQLESSSVLLDGYYSVFDLAYGYNRRLDAFPTQNALLFMNFEHNRKIIGSQRQCWFKGKFDFRNCYDDTPTQLIPGCTYRTGLVTCKQFSGNTEEWCTGAPQECTVLDNGTSVCAPLEIDMDAFEMECSADDITRYQCAYRAHILDLRNPSTPVWRDTVVLPKTEDTVGVLSYGSLLYFNYKVDHLVPGDPRAYVKYYYRVIDFSDPSAPVMSESINIPGILIAMKGNTIYTRDPVYNSQQIDFRVNRLSIKNSAAFLESTIRFDNRVLKSVTLDERGYLLVNHRERQDCSRETEVIEQLTIYEGWGNMVEVGGLDVPDKAILKWVENGQALFSVPRGAYLVDTVDPHSPTRTRFFPVDQWPAGLTSSDTRLYIPAADYGIYDISF
jgi:hypothetical protein